MSTAAPDNLRVAPAEIPAYLQQLQRDQATVLLTGPPGLSLACRIGVVEPAADVLGLELGADPDGLSQALVAGGEITGVAYQGSIRLQFDLDGAVLVSGAQGAVLRSPLPTRLYRFQRRESFRVQPAGSVYPRVVLPGGGEPGAPAEALRVLDISIGGLALAQPTDAGRLQPGQAAQPAVLELDRTTALHVTLLPHHASPMADAAGPAPALQQLGCAFVDLDAVAGRALQVYVDQTQKRRRLLKLDA